MICFKRGASLQFINPALSPDVQLRFFIFHFTYIAGEGRMVARSAFLYIIKS